MEKPGLKRENTKPAPKEEATELPAQTLQLVKRDHSMLNFQRVPEKTKRRTITQWRAIEPFLGPRYQQESRKY